jgi:CheY-like chemotaxis protein
MSVFGINVLLIEDNRADREYIGFVLNQKKPPGQTMEYNIDSFETLVEAKKSLPSHMLDVILLDLILPGSEAMETFDKARAVAVAPIVAITGLDDWSVVSKVAGRGGMFMVKDWLVSTPVLLHYIIAMSMEMNRQREAIMVLEKARMGDSRNLAKACMDCNRWQDPATGEWFSPAIYIQKYAGVGLTHGVCVECAQKRSSEMSKS